MVSIGLRCEYPLLCELVSWSFALLLLVFVCVVVRQVWRLYLEQKQSRATTKKKMSARKGRKRF